VELRANGDRAVLTSQVGVEEREVDVSTLALPEDLPTALHEWARVVAAVHRSGPAGDLSAANSVVSHRGRQLAGRLAAATGSPVSYRDPMTGDVSVVTAGEDDAGEPAADESPAPEPRPATSDEPTPWATGLTVSAFMAVVTFEAVFTLTATVQETAGWLAVLANLLVTAGLSPSVWLARRVRVWRWVSLGTAAGLAFGWLCLPFVLFSG
jgi:hypothetical protein